MTAPADSEAEALDGTDEGPAMDEHWRSSLRIIRARLTRLRPLRMMIVSGAILLAPPEPQKGPCTCTEIWSKPASITATRPLAFGKRISVFLMPKYSWPMALAMA